MGIVAKRKHIFNYFNSNFSAIDFDQIVWENVQNTKINTNLPWISVYMSEVDTFFASLGTTRRVRHVGLLSFQIFIQPGETTLLADEILDSIADALEGKTTLESVCFGTLETNNVGVVEAYYQVNATIPYRYDEYRS